MRFPDQQASSCSSCQIVSIDWLLESDKAKKPLPEKSYLFVSAQAAPKQDAVNGIADKPEKKKRATRQDNKQNGAADKVETKKRASPQPSGSGNTSEKKPKSAQKASSKSLKVPVDESYCFCEAHFSDPAVHIDDSGLIWDATLNQTVASNNANKFYRIQLLAGRNATEYYTWTRWGRVGETGQWAHLGDGTLKKAMADFEKKFKDKSGLKWENRTDTPKNGKYTFIERNYEDDDEDEDADTKQVAKKEKKQVESLLPEATQTLMTFIFNQDHFLSTMASMSYDAQKLPLGKLSKRTLEDGFRVLKDLSELVSSPTLASSRWGTTFNAAAEELSNRYFTTIPHVFGRNRPPVLSSEAQIKKEVDLLEALTDMDVANEIMNDSKDADEIHMLDRQFQGLGMNEMTPLDHKSAEFKELEQYLSQTRGSTHRIRYSVINIFRIERQGENERFEQSKYANIKNSDRRLLWHGSRSTNFGGILSQGLRIAPPEAPVNGYMFGKGVYLADASSKSANYCNAYNSANMGLLLLCDAELGDPMLELYDADYKACENALKQGKIATLGQGRTRPGGWKDAGCLHENLQGVKMPDVSSGFLSYNAACLQYNEYIAYDVAQIRQRYLFHVHMS
ncbi:hypothetical protein AWENTII_003772 [Aspergillus wentii]